jgi:hypothetical protein
MYINKPKVPEELYQFFTKGMPLNHKKGRSYLNHLKRKGWNTYLNFIKYRDGNQAVRMEFFSAIAYRPGWILMIPKYADTETN